MTDRIVAWGTAAIITAGLLVEANHGYTAAATARQEARHHAAQLQRAEWLEAVFRACLRHDIFFVDDTAFTCIAQETQLKRQHLKEELIRG